MHEMQWVQSGGGPLIVIPVEIAHLWRGIGGLGLPNGDLSMVWETVRDHTDYGRACGVDDYLGVLKVGHGDCLVFGDEPLETAFQPTEDGGIFVRWVHAQQEEDVVRAVQVVPEDVWQPSPHMFHVRRGGLLLFDSACPGDDLPSPRIEGVVSWMRVPVPGGTYEVDTADYEPDDHTRVILHRLRRSTFTED
jgi:Immunity protein 21